MVIVPRQYRLGVNQDLDMTIGKFDADGPDDAHDSSDSDDSDDLEEFPLGVDDQVKQHINHYRNASRHIMKKNCHRQ